MPSFWNICARTLASKALEITDSLLAMGAMALCMADSPPAMTSETVLTAWVWD